MEKLRKDSKDYAEHQNQMKVNLVSLSKSIGPIAISSEKISTAASSIKEMGEKIPIFGNVLKKTLGKVNDFGKEKTEKSTKPDSNFLQNELLKLRIS